MKPAVDLKLTWRSEVLDSGRVLLVHVDMEPAMVQAEVRALLMEAGARSPLKGFRPGRVQESALRRVHGKRVLAAARDGLVDRCSKVVLAEVAKKHGFELDRAPEPGGVCFSEEAGLHFELAILGLSLPASVSADPVGTVVDFRGSQIARSEA